VFHAAPADVVALGLAGPMLSAQAFEGGTALRLAPDEWLLLDVRPGFAPDIAHSLVDVSARTLATLLSGPRAAELLNSACPLDLDEAAFPVGACSRTLFGKVTVLLWRRDDGFRLDVARSFEPYTTGLLRQAAQDLAETG
jgi:sarcosine oxidase subunit gamma